MTDYYDRYSTLPKRAMIIVDDDEDTTPLDRDAIAETVRKTERLARIERAKRYADKAGDESLFAETRAAWAAAGMLELAIVQAEDPRFAPPF